MSETTISIQRLTKSYGPVRALRGVDLEVQRDIRVSGEGSWRLPARLNFGKERRAA